jgi:hypothetical protein
MGDLRDKIAASAKAKSSQFLSELGPAIEVEVAQCEGYPAVLRGEYSAALSLDELIKLASRRGRVIVCGRGASGKSALLHRLTIRAAELRIAPFFIGLSRWDQAATDDWQEVKETPRDALDFLLMRFGWSEYDITDAEFLPSTAEKLFLVDGLNETPGSIADEILAACDQIASMVVGASIIVSDRIVRRSLHSESRWRFAMPLPVTPTEIDRSMQGKQVPSGAEVLLSSPFFLDKGMRGELRTSPLGTIKELIENRGKLDPQGLSAASEAAFRAYEIDQSRTFDRARFASLGRADVADTLLAGGILLPAGTDRVAFMHHWVHDYLASRYVIEQPDLWNSKNRHRVLDALTFRANSFDAIAFALELSSSAASGEFLQAVYDWNPYAAGYALAEAKIGLDHVPHDVRLIILSMLAEKRFDRHFFSARRACDALDLLNDADAKSMRAASSLDEVAALVSAVESPSETFATWRRLFTLKPGQAATDETIQALPRENSIIGWTAANVLKRLKLTDGQIASVVAVANHERPVVRWRAVHAMGGFTIDSFIAELFNRLKQDPDENVKYGAIRSLIEAASRDAAMLPAIVDGLIKHLDVIMLSSKVSGELTRAVFLSEGCAPPNWIQEISRVFYELMERARDTMEVERWSKLTSRLRVHHRVEPKLAA